MHREINKKNLKGFSLFELLVTMGILMILSLMVFPLAINKTQESKLESYASQLVTDIYYQQQSCTFKNLSGGISLGTNTYTIYDGNSLSEATDTDFKEYPSNIHLTSISMTNSNNIFFNQGKFKPVSYGTLIITDGINSIRVFINREGLTGYEKI